MGDTVYIVNIERHTENDGGAFVRKGAQGSVETLSVSDAASRYGKERIIQVLEDQLRLLRDGPEAHLRWLRTGVR